VGTLARFGGGRGSPHCARLTHRPRVPMRSC
jgi:hypothetical protein